MIYTNLNYFDVEISNLGEKIRVYRVCEKQRRVKYLRAREYTIWKILR